MAIAYQITNISNGAVSVDGFDIPRGGVLTVKNNSVNLQAAVDGGYVSVVQVDDTAPDLRGIVTSVNGKTGDVDLYDDLRDAAETATEGITSGFSGFSGKSGYSGYSAASGFSGFSGKSGYSGYSAISGFSGFSSVSGFSGFSAASGFSGFSGPGSGFSGYSGKSGFSGYSSTSGFSGFSSTSGFSGYSGKSGFSGAVTKAAFVDYTSPTFAYDLTQSLIAANLMNAS